MRPISTLTILAMIFVAVEPVLCDDSIDSHTIDVKLWNADNLTSLVTIERRAARLALDKDTVIGPLNHASDLVTLLQVRVPAATGGHGKDRYLGTVVFRHDDARVTPSSVTARLSLDTRDRKVYLVVGVRRGPLGEIGVYEFDFNEDKEPIAAAKPITEAQLRHAVSPVTTTTITNVGGVGELFVGRTESGLLITALAANSQDAPNYLVYEFASHAIRKSMVLTEKQ